MTKKPDDPHEAVTRADRITPHDEPRQKSPHDEDEPTPGIVDPRHLRNGPEILEPPTPGLEPPDDDFQDDDK